MHGRVLLLPGREREAAQYVAEEVEGKAKLLDSGRADIEVTPVGWHCSVAPASGADVRPALELAWPEGYRDSDPNR